VHEPEQTAPIIASASRRDRKPDRLAQRAGIFIVHARVFAAVDQPDACVR